MVQAAVEAAQSFFRRVFGCLETTAGKSKSLPGFQPLHLLAYHPVHRSRLLLTPADSPAPQ